MKMIFFNISLLFIGLSFFSCSEEKIETPTEVKPVVIPEKAYVLAEQSKTSIVIMDAETKKNIWSWDPFTAGVPYTYVQLFKNPSEVKPVFNRKYILMTASGGAVALIRISDHKLMFCGNAGRNPHSAEILPDGNIVTASSSDHLISTFVTDTVKVFCSANKTLKLGDAHNVVWDKKRELIYATASVKNSNNENCVGLFSFEYNGKGQNPELVNMKRIKTKEDDRGAHDLFPVEGETDKLWLTTLNKVYKYNVELNDFKEAFEIEAFKIEDIKSIDKMGNEIIMLKPIEEWWTDGLINEKGENLFKLKGSKIYKGRWMRDNLFSYPEVHEFVLSNDN